jgi:hypothetical protein
MTSEKMLKELFDDEEEDTKRMTVIRILADYNFSDHAVGYLVRELLHNKHPYFDHNAEDCPEHKQE